MNVPPRVKLSIAVDLVALPSPRAVGSAKLEHEEAFASLDELSAFEQAIANGDRPAVRAMNYRFHSHFYSLAKQPQTLHFMQVLWAKYPFDLINLIGGRVGRAAQEHGAILKAIAAGDEPAALTAVREHIETGWQELQQAIGQTGYGMPAKEATP